MLKMPLFEFGWGRHGGPSALRAGAFRMPLHFGSAPAATAGSHSRCGVAVEALLAAHAAAAFIQIPKAHTGMRKNVRRKWAVAGTHYARADACALFRSVFFRHAKGESEFELRSRRIARVRF